MKPLFTLLGMAALLAIFFQAIYYLIQHVEVVRDHNIYRPRIVWNEL